MGKLEKIKKEFESFRVQYEEEWNENPDSAKFRAPTLLHERIATVGLAKLFELIAENLEYDDSEDVKRRVIDYAYKTVLIYGAMDTKVAKNFSSLLKDFSSMVLLGDADKRIGALKITIVDDPVIDDE